MITPVVAALGLARPGPYVSGTADDGDFPHWFFGASFPAFIRPAASVLLKLSHPCLVGGAVNQWVCWGFGGGFGRAGGFCVSFSDDGFH